MLASEEELRKTPEPGTISQPATEQSPTDVPCVIDIDNDDESIASPESEVSQESSNAVPTIGDPQQTSPPEPMFPPPALSCGSSAAAEGDEVSHSGTPNLPLPTFSTLAEPDMPMHLGILANHLVHNADAIFQYTAYAPQQGGLPTQPPLDTSLNPLPIPEEWITLTIDPAAEGANVQGEVSLSNNALNEVDPPHHNWICCQCLLM